MEAKSSQSLQEWRQCLLVKGLNDFSVTLSFTPRKTLLNTKLKICLLESAVFAPHNCENPIFLGDVLPELLFNQFLRVLSIIM